MITYLKKEIYDMASVPVTNVVEIACLSTDTKPTSGIATGSLALEVDTGDIYAYDEVGTSWTKINA